MTTTIETPARSTPWHFWLIAGLSLPWNSFGAFDYTMSHVRGDAYYRQAGMTEAQIAAMAAYPAWMHAVWAVGVWGSALGSVLLLLRSKWAFHAFAVSILGAIGNLAYSATHSMGGPAEMGLPVLIITVCGLLIWYAWAMTKRGVLR